MSNHSQVGTMDILAAAFFVIAGCWLLVALLHSTLVLVFLRLRARGELGSIYEEDFGRWYIFGNNTRCYIPLGCIFRRYIAHLQYDAGGATPSEPVRFMTREERRNAMETLLLSEETDNRGGWKKTVHALVSKKNEEKAKEEQEKVVVDADQQHQCDENDEALSTQEPVCSICLGEYDEEDPVLNSRTCSHQFHTECIMDWLQRQANSECPCCRVAMVQEDDVWEIVKKQRKAKKRAMRRRRKQQEQPSEVEMGSTENSDDDEEVVEAVVDSSSSSNNLHVVERLDV